MVEFAVPQLVVDSRMLYFGWLPADPQAVAALLPAGLRPTPDRRVFLHQYVVDDAEQTSGFDAFSATCLGPDLAGLPTPDGVGAGRWWAQYVSSSRLVRAHAAAAGAPVAAGRTSIEVRGSRLTTVTEVEGTELIRTTARVGRTVQRIIRGQVRYVTWHDGQLRSAYHPYVAERVDLFEVESVEFPVADHPLYALRPANPLEIRWGFYAPRSAFVCPGGGSPLRPGRPGGDHHQDGLNRDHQDE